MVGKRYRVLSDNMYVFNPGDIVVSVDESDDCPYCVLEEDYVEGYELKDYNYSYHAMSNDELEEL